jgi:FKBP-type peptidyl-prolyl cis-trans isomerase FkpA
MKIKSLIVLGIVAVMFSSCKKDDESQADIDDRIIQDYLKEHNLDAEKHESGLYYIITVEGTGEHPTLSSTVEVLYKGYLTDGTVFDETSDNAPVSFPLQSLIAGWQIGIPLMKPGGQATIFLPSHLGYGSSPQNGIPANSVLIFDITLLDFTN